MRFEHIVLILPFAVACGSGFVTEPDADAAAESDAGNDGAGDLVPDAVPDETMETEEEEEADVPDEVADESGGEDAPAACPVADDLGSGDHTQTLFFDLLLRSYIAHVPASYDAGVPMPVVLNLHGLMSAAWQQVLFSGMNPTADRAGFIAVYPDGLGSSWNAGVCCGSSALTGVDDVGFLRAAVEDLAAKLCIDRRRIYATGMSNGGYMSHRLGCEAADLFAAIAPVAGAMGITGCTPARPVPVIAFHGVQDGLVSYADGRAAIEQWAALDGCPGDPVRTDHGGSYCETWSGCSAGTEVTLCTLDPMGHCWPGGSETLCLGPIGPFNGA